MKKIKTYEYSIKNMKTKHIGGLGHPHNQPNKKCKECRYYPVRKVRKGAIAGSPYAFFICWDCYDSIPCYIPKEQISKFLIEKS